MTVSLSDSDSSWGSFADTVLDFKCDPPLVLDLRRSIDRAGVIRLRQAGLERSFGIVTAENPCGSLLPKSVNAVRTEALRVEVAGLRASSADVAACSPDRSHCEDSLAISIELRIH